MSERNSENSRLKYGGGRGLYLDLHCKVPFLQDRNLSLGAMEACSSQKWLRPLEDRDRRVCYEPIK